MRKNKGIKRNVWVFGLTSFLNDIASGAMAPLTPIFVVNYLGANPGILGLIEGIAKGTLNLSKPFFGYLSDRLRKRKIFVELGYSTSVIGRFLIAFSFSWPVFLLGRFIDRLGKGMRVPTRDAIISASSTRKKRGRAFGLHRALGRSGEVLGPLLGFLILPYLSGVTSSIKHWLQFFNPLNTLFLVVSIPMILGPLIIHHYITEVKFSGEHTPSKIASRFKRFVMVVGFFNLANFPIAFIFLRANELGVKIGGSLLIYTFFNIAYVLTAYAGGHLVDRFGGKQVLGSSFLFLSISSLMLAFSKSVFPLLVSILIFAMSYALYIVSNRSFTSLISRQERLGTSYGLLDLTIGVASLLSGSMMGFVWGLMGASAAFLIVSGISLVSIPLLKFLV